MKLLFVGVALVSAIFTGCKKDKDPEPNNTEGLVLIATGYTDAGGIKVSLYAKDSLYSQYTPLFVEVRDSATNAVIEDAHIEIMPMMDMTTMVHSAPYENPSSTDAVNGLFPCAVVFQMPGDMGWTLDVHVHEHVNGGEGEVTFPLVVMNPDPTRTRVITPLNSSSSRLVVSYVLPTEGKVGINDFEITLHSRETMMSWPAIENYTIEIEPEMPSMGHGSPNNVNPTHTGNGHYEGKVNFTMTGLWRINLTIMDGTTVVDSTAYFDITLQ
ncbi:MAG: FixH family protein [Flavobacteriales bacterium]|nr:FixH family protein [Flavobacteriales bacterium]